MEEIQTARFYLLDGNTGWRTGEGSNVEAGLSAGPSGIQLRTDPQGPLSLGWPDGSLGGLVLPRGLALDRQRSVYLLAPIPPYRLLRYHRERGEFLPVPGLGDNPLNDPRRFTLPTNIAIDGSQLFVADRGSRRVLVFELSTLTLLYELQPYAQRIGSWHPLDVAAGGGSAWILDSRNNAVYHFDSHSGELRRVTLVRRSNARWKRIALDQRGWLYLLRRADSAELPRSSICNPPPRLKKAALVLDVYDQEGHFQGTVEDPGDVRDRFSPPALRLYFAGSHSSDQPNLGRGIFCLPADLAGDCAPVLTEASPPVEAPLQLCSDPTVPGKFFDRCGQPVNVDFAELVDPLVYQTRGTWISGPLDSRIHQCQWHRVELDLGPLPLDCTITISTYTSSSDFSRPFSSSPLWDKGHEFTRTVQPEGTLPEIGSIPPDFLVQSREGRYLWLKVELSGTGFGTPLLNALRVYYPRQSYLEYLPAIYATDPESHWFLERFLSLFQSEWDDIEHTLETFERYFDAAAVPAGDFLNALAAWLGLPLEGDWDPEQRRNLLLSVREVYPHRGTAAGLRGYLQAYLQNMTGLRPDDQGEFPLLIEGFRMRQYLLLRHPEQAAKGQMRRLWSPQVTGRLQVGVTSRLGQARVVSTGDPSLDVFDEYAHRFSIYMPATWLRTADDEQRLRRAIEREKPAHTIYDLHLVEARFRIGVQATVGLDTVLGCYPTVHLTCPTRECQLPPSRRRGPSLGYNTVLSRSPAQPRDPVGQYIL
jgi:phage tail-like protein